MAHVRATESFSGLLACMGAGQEDEFDDETAARMAAEGYPVELIGGEPDPGPEPDAGEGGGSDGGDGGGEPDPGPEPDAGA